VKISHSNLTLAVLPVIVFIGFLIQFCLEIVANLRREPTPGFAVDAPEYFVPLYHVILVPLIVAVLFGRKYFAALTITLLYLAAHSWGMYSRHQGCFLGGDICPPVSVWSKAVARFSWFDWTATFVIPIILISLVYTVLVKAKNGRLR
jgi:hypothetical protein